MDLIAVASSSRTELRPLSYFPGQGDLLSWCENMATGTGLLLLLGGMVYLLYGYTVFKPLITINAAIIGGYIGALIGQKYGYTVGFGALGSILAAAITVPLMKWAVAVIGGICGALFGAGIWRTVGLDPQMAWAGAMTGLVGFGMFSFILFRGSIIMYTSLQGATMVIVGVLILLFKYQGASSQLMETMKNQPMVLPVSVFIPAILGLIFQQTKGAGGAAAGGGGDKKK